MGLQSTTRQVVETNISRKQNFKRGNVSGKWVNRNYFSGTSIGKLPSEFAKVLAEHNKGTDLFVLYSYQTPMAWFRLDDSDSNGDNKWYYVEQHYSMSTTQHQHAFRYALKGENVVTLSLDESGNLVEDEKEYF